MELLEKIEQILDRQVRPQLALHYGDVVVMGIEGGTLNVRLTGQCGGCPSAALTTESLIAETLRTAIPEVREVILNNGVSENLLEEARALLARRPV